ncbi:MAG: HAMP domain-containing protein [Anaerolineales bacterium]|nr:HAMP domain-containing protein [Anaerolineales bacterium]
MNPVSSPQFEIKNRFRLFNSIQGKLLGFFLALALLPLLAIGIFSDWKNQHALYTDATDELATLANIQADEINSWLDDRLREMKVIAGSDEAQSMDYDRVEEIIELYAQEYLQYETLFVAGRDGMTIFHNNSDTPLHLGDRAYFQKALQGEPNISDALVSKSSGNIIVVAAAPIIVDGQVVGVVGGTIPTTEIAELLAHARTGQSGEAYLINRDGYMITPSRFTDDLKAQGLIKKQTELELKVNTMGAQEALAGKSGVNEYPDYRGLPVLGAYTPIKQMDWGLLVEVDTSEALATATQMRNLGLLIGLITTVIVVGFAVFVARKMTQPILSMTEAARRLATGDVNQTVEVKSNDELGAMASAFQEMMDYMQEMTSAAQRLAQGDLTVDIQPRSEQDTLGLAFHHMLVNLRGLVQQIAENATSVELASSQLSGAADQSAQATSHIAGTMQQIANGVNRQVTSINHTVSAVTQTNQAIEGVAQGAQEQAAAITRGAMMANQIADTIEQIAQGAEAAADKGANSTQTAQTGAQTVQHAIETLDSIKLAVELAGEKVTEMGHLSGQIGGIVETIDDIASQTNLLALNAAIEAARAGEHGKGFAVVADEVRKLAEMSATATKEIVDLIRNIQNRVAEAIQAMAQSSAEVNNGAIQAEQAGQALTNILELIEGMQQDAADAVRLTTQARAASEELSSTMDSISAVVEENTASTEEMAATSIVVQEEIESIANVSRENATMVEEVSASTEEMSAQAEEVTASAQVMAEMAEKLRQTVAQFKVAVSGQMEVKSVQPVPSNLPRLIHQPYTNGHHRVMNGH